jgi:hypothetical protein
MRKALKDVRIAEIDTWMTKFAAEDPEGFERELKRLGEKYFGQEGWARMSAVRNKAVAEQTDPRPASGGKGAVADNPGSAA